jgi:hypothetical protein
LLIIMSELINIVNYELSFQNTGILSKYSYCLERELKALGREVAVTPLPDPAALINYHINYLSYRPTDTYDYLMITHLTGDENHSHEKKFEFLKASLETSFGITMSRVLMDGLIAQGLPAEKLGYILPAHDSIPRRPRVIAILTDIKHDKRKREWMYTDLFKSIDKSKFDFLIMGKGWDETLKGADIYYKLYPMFDLSIYKRILNQADYCLYVGDEDCVSQSLIDALQAGIKTIFPDIPTNHEFGKVAHLFNTQEELNAIFKKLEKNPVEHLTWANYAKRHLEIWDKV